MASSPLRAAISQIGSLMLVLPSLPGGLRQTPVAGIERELDLARLSILITNLPLLYGVICVHIIVTAYSFSGVAPPGLVYGLPLAFILFAVFRAVHFIRLRKAIPVDGRVAHDMLRIVQFIAVGFGSLGVAWMVELYLYGDSALRSQLVFSVFITNMICSYILGQLPRVALTLAGISMPGFLLLLVLTGGPEALVIAFNLGLVGLFLAYIVMVSARDFERMVAAKLHAVELAEENRLLAITDSLTGLPNRREFFERLESAIREEGATGGLVMGVIDLDGFKPINDLYGHAIGDCVLRECAARLEIFSGGGTTFARLGGDEFAIFGAAVSRRAIFSGWANRSAPRCARRCVSPTSIPAYRPRSVSPAILRTRWTGIISMRGPITRSISASRTTAAPPCCSRPNTRARCCSTAGSSRGCARRISNGS
jgi:predicted signal transduction protein with EAL and GGDEF domain